MTDLQNKLTWSFSRRQLFESCRRAYFLHYYLSWAGWEDYAPKRSRLAYRLKKIQSIDAYVGSRVHDEISRIVACLSAHGTIRRR